MTTPDWTVMDLHGVRDEVKRAAVSVAAMYPTFSTAEDLEQEGYIYLATNAEQVRKFHAQEDGLLPVVIWRALRGKVRTEARRQADTIGIHRLYEGAE